MSGAYDHRDDHDTGDPYDLTPGELLSIPLRLTGVIVGVSEHITFEHTRTIMDGLERKFPGVRFAVVSGCSSLVSFTYDDTEEQP